MSEGPERVVPELKPSGVHRMLSAKGKGFWFAKHDKEEKVFYDGVYGTMGAAKNAADKWYNEVRSGGAGVFAVQEKVREFMDWLDGEEWLTGEQRDKLGDKLYDLFK